jgi:UDP-N-acetyl-D-mannosaminuronate dehydrogenase
MNLDQYPAAIAESAQPVNELEARLVTLRQQQADLESQADLQIAFDPELKNELQRKVRRSELLSSSEYWQVVQAIALLSQEKATALTMLERLRNEFTVAKLHLRRHIAELIVDPDSRELVGVFGL